MAEVYIFTPADREEAAGVLSGKLTDVIPKLKRDPSERIAPGAAALTAVALFVTTLAPGLSPRPAYADTENSQGVVTEPTEASQQGTESTEEGDSDRPDSAGTTQPDQPRGVNTGSQDGAAPDNESADAAAVDSEQGTAIEGARDPQTVSEQPVSLTTFMEPSATTDGEAQPEGDVLQNPQTPRQSGTPDRDEDSEAPVVIEEDAVERGVEGANANAVENEVQEASLINPSGPIAPSNQTPNNSSGEPRGGFNEPSLFEQPSAPTNDEAGRAPTPTTLADFMQPSVSEAALEEPRPVNATSSEEDLPIVTPATDTATEGPGAANQNNNSEEAVGSEIEVSGDQTTLADLISVGGSESSETAPQDDETEEQPEPQNEEAAEPEIEVAIDTIARRSILEVEVSDSVRDNFNRNSKEKIEALRSVYEEIEAITGVPAALMAAIHFREGGNSPNHSMFAGERLGSTNPDFGDVKPTNLIENGVKAAKHLIKMAKSVYGVEVGPDMTLEDAELAFLAYNRGSMYENAGEEEALGRKMTPDESRYVYNDSTQRWANVGNYNNPGLKWGEPQSVQGRVNQQLGAIEVYRLTEELFGPRVVTGNATSTHVQEDGQVSGTEAYEEDEVDITNVSQVEETAATVTEAPEQGDASITQLLEQGSSAITLADFMMPTNPGSVAETSSSVADALDEEEANEEEEEETQIEQVAEETLEVPANSDDSDNEGVSTGTTLLDFMSPVASSDPEIIVERNAQAAPPEQESELTTEAAATEEVSEQAGDDEQLETVVAVEEEKPQNTEASTSDEVAQNDEVEEDGASDLTANNNTTITQVPESGEPTITSSASEPEGSGTITLADLIDVSESSTITPLPGDSSPSDSVGEAAEQELGESDTQDEVVADDVEVAPDEEADTSDEAKDGTDEPQQVDFANIGASGPVLAQPDAED
jgi:hypothetical protein